MSRETKVGLVVALSFLLLVGGVLGYKLYFTGDPLLSLSEGTNNAVVQSDQQPPGGENPPVVEPGKPAEPAPDGQDQPKEKKPKKSREEKALAKANNEQTRPTEGPPPTEEPAKPAAENKSTETAGPANGRPMTPAEEPSDKAGTGGPSLTPKERPGAVVATGPSGPPPAEEMPKLGRPPAEKPMGPPPAEEMPKLGGPPMPDEAVKPALNEKPSAGPPQPEEIVKSNERPMVGGPPMPPPAEEMRPMPEKTGGPPPTEEPTKPQPFNEKPGAQPPPLPPAEEIRRNGPPPAEQPMTNLPPSPPAFEAKPGGPSGSPLELAPRITGPAGSSPMPPMPETPKDVPPPAAPNTFERKYDVPALGKPEVARGPSSGTLVSGQQDSRPGIPLTVRPQPGKQPHTDTGGGVPVVIQPPTWNTPDGRASAQVESFEMEVYVLKPGDTYATVSQMRYRSDRYQNALAQFNRERDGRLSSPQAGMSVFLPPAGYLERRYGVANPAAPGRGTAPEASQGWNAAARDKNVQPAGGRVDAPPESKPVVQAEGSLPPNAKRYRVRPNDTIWNIAKTTLGNGERWPDILKLNRDVLPDVNRLQAGTILRLPDDARVDASETAQ